MALMRVLMELMKNSSLMDIVMLMLPVCAALGIGVLVGWLWRPNWVNAETNSPSLTIPSLQSVKLKLPAFVSWTSNNDSVEDFRFVLMYLIH